MRLETRTVALKDGRTCVVRNLEGKDAAAALEHLRQTAAETPYLLWEPETDRMMTEEEEEVFLSKSLDAPEQVMLGAFLEDRLVAIANIGYNGRRSRVRHRGNLGISLRKEVWSVGLGTYMMQILIEAAPRMGITQIELEVMEPNKSARGLYEKLGFQVYGRRPNASRLKTGECMDDLLMVLLL